MTNRIKEVVISFTLVVATIAIHAQTSNFFIVQRSVANVSIKIDAQRGARIASLQIDSNEILYLDTTNGYWGSTFWPSPQSAWNWPPPAKLDKDTYSIVEPGNQILLKSGIDEITKLSVNKTIICSDIDTSFIIRYTMINHDTVIRKYAPWEITRVPAEGFVFAEKKTKDIGFIWFDLNEPSTEKAKVNSDGVGWQAYVNNDGYLLIKTYTDILPQETAPGEGEFELYRDKNIYVELENQGRYREIEPGDSLVWDVKWYVRELPESIKPELKSNKLIDYVYRYVDKSEKQLNE